MNDFKVGDVVRHKASGDFGPVMSVNSISDGAITCIYWNKISGHFERTDFFAEELVTTQPAKRGMAISS
jgi:uncharacterized protein YodC (DUF2158 family)